MKSLINIQEFLVRLTDPLYPIRSKRVIEVTTATVVSSHKLGWMPITSLVGKFFWPAFGKRNPFNIPGPFYGAETDTCETGTAEAPQNILLDRLGQEFVFRQPTNNDEMRDIISAAVCESVAGYGADGDDNWTVALIREWWRSRHHLLALSEQVMGTPESKLRWQRILSGKGEAYLRAYAFFVDCRQLPRDDDALPEVR